MDTFEARTRMRVLALEAMVVVERREHGGNPESGDSAKLRQLVGEARAVLADAGYPGEAVWRGLHRASIGYETQLDGSVRGYWEDVRLDLLSGIETLDLLLGPAIGRDVDFPLIG